MLRSTSISQRTYSCAAVSVFRPEKRITTDFWHELCVYSCYTNIKQGENTTWLCNNSLQVENNGARGQVSCSVSPSHRSHRLPRHLFFSCLSVGATSLSFVTFSGAYTFSNFDCGDWIKKGLYQFCFSVTPLVSVNQTLVPNLAHD